MNTNTRSHVSGKLDAMEVEYVELREAVIRHTSLMGATSGLGKGPTAMDIGSIATVEDAEGAGGEQQPQHAQEKVLSVDENGCPTDDEGWPVEGYIDEQLNFVKGAKGKGKGNFQGACFNCGKNGHRAADCKGLSTTGKGAYGKAKGKADGKGKGKGSGVCWTCLKTGCQAKNCPEGQSKGK